MHHSNVRCLKAYSPWPLQCDLFHLLLDAAARYFALTLPCLFAQCPVLVGPVLDSALTVIVRNLAGQPLGLFPWIFYYYFQRYWRALAMSWIPQNHSKKIGPHAKTFPLYVHNRNPLKLNFTVPYCGFSLACATPHIAFDVDFLAVLESEMAVIKMQMQC